MQVGTIATKIVSERHLLLIVGLEPLLDLVHLLNFSAVSGRQILVFYEFSVIQLFVQERGLAFLLKC